MAGDAVEADVAVEPATGVSEEEPVRGHAILGAAILAGPAAPKGAAAPAEVAVGVAVGEGVSSGILGGSVGIGGNGVGVAWPGANA